MERGDWLYLWQAPEWPAMRYEASLAALAKCSSDTALRDIRELLDRGVLRKGSGAGRNTSYELADE
ncbi:hypothetical protein ACPWR0_07900 [Pandoraea pneumonica]|uniref:hypothetical protein n=1 Tax=Pandoraea pneumonica TaxID=2508299 RepID=UPI003CF7ACE6